MAEAEGHCAADVWVGVVEVDEDGVDHVVEGRLGEFYVPAGEEDVYCGCHLQPDWVLGVVQSLQQHWVELLQLVVADFL